MLITNYLLAVFVTVFVLQLCFSLWLEKLNRQHLTSAKIPDTLKNNIDKNKLSEINSYNLAKSQLEQISVVVSSTVLLLIILTGLLPTMDVFSDILGSHYVLRGVSFFLVLGFLDYLVTLPFNYYNTFVVEEKYGFNCSTLKTWISDHIKGGILSFVLTLLTLSPIFWLLKNFPNWWWLLGFVVISLVQVLLTVAYPVLIAPIFNKFVVLEDKELYKKVTKQMEETGIKIKDILQMDAGKRSRHTNAYFTGLGKSKRIVFYDTLLKSHSHEEILAILAHEAGHFKEKHIIKQLIFFEGGMLAFLYLTHLMIGWEAIPLTFGSSEAYINLFLIFTFWEKSGYFLKPIYMALSRRFEYQADLFSLKLLKTEKPMIDSLKRLVTDNLTNINPHPLYVRFHYSHPPITERILFLEKAVKNI